MRSFPRRFVLVLRLTIHPRHVTWTLSDYTAVVGVFADEQSAKKWNDDLTSALKDPETFGVRDIDVQIGPHSVEPWTPTQEIDIRQNEDDGDIEEIVHDLFDRVSEAIKRALEQPGFINA